MENLFDSEVENNALFESALESVLESSESELTVSSSEDEFETILAPATPLTLPPTKPFITEEEAAAEVEFAEFWDSLGKSAHEESSEESEGFKDFSALPSSPLLLITTITGRSFLTRSTPKAATRWPPTHIPALP